MNRSVAPQTLPHVPCSYFCSCAEKWKMGRHFLKKRSQEHPCELHWIPQRSWKTSNEGCTASRNFTKISGVLVSAVTWANSIHCGLSALLRQYYHGFVCATTGFQSRWWMKLFSRVQKLTKKKSLNKIWDTFSQENMNTASLVGKCHNPGLLKTKITPLV